MILISLKKKNNPPMIVKTSLRPEGEFYVILKHVISSAKLFDKFQEAAVTLTLPAPEVSA